MKEKINLDEANKRLIDTLYSHDFEDRVYEFAQECFHRGIAKVEESATIVDEDGRCLDSEQPNEDGNMWYDDIMEDFFDECYQRLYDFLHLNKGTC